LLSEIEVSPIEEITMVRVIRYLKKLNKWKRVGDLKLSLITYCEIEKRLGCNKITNGLVNGVFA